MAKSYVLQQLLNQLKEGVEQRAPYKREMTQKEFEKIRAMCNAFLDTMDTFNPTVQEYLTAVSTSIYTILALYSKNGASIDIDEAAKSIAEAVATANASFKGKPPR